MANIEKENRIRIQKEKALCYILRHNPKEYNIELDCDGFALVTDIYRSLSAYGVDEIDIIGMGSEVGGRLELNFDRTMIRAKYGHSINLDFKYKESTINGLIFHGTKSRHIDSIAQSGILSGNRQFVHLYSDLDKAWKKASRFIGNQTSVIEVDVMQLRNNGLSVYEADKDVILVKYVPSSCIKSILTNHNYNF